MGEVNIILNKIAFICIPGNLRSSDYGRLLTIKTSLVESSIKVSNIFIKERR